MSFLVVAALMGLAFVPAFVLGFLGNVHLSWGWGALLIVSTLLGLIPAFVAKQRGRDFFLWWLYGAAIFIVALPHSLLIGPVKPGEPNPFKLPPASGSDKGLIASETAAQPFAGEAPAKGSGSSVVFISHSSKDREPALTVCKALENRGVRCWLAARDIDPGENFQASIHRAIRSAKAMVLVFTQNANSSPEINKELALASQYELMVIPVRVEDVIPNDALAYELATRQWINLFEDWETQVQRLTARITAIAPAG